MSCQGLGTSAWVLVVLGCSTKATDFRPLIILCSEGSFLLNLRTMVLKEYLRALFTSVLIELVLEASLPFLRSYELFQWWTLISAHLHSTVTQAEPKIHMGGPRISKTP